MKLFSFIFIICFLAGCASAISTPTYRGEGSYQRMLDDQSVSSLYAD